MKHTHPQDKKLTAAEVAAVCKDEQSLASYLATLTPAQVQDLRAATESGAMNMPEPVKKTFLKLLTIVEERAAGYEKEFNEKVAPLAHGIAVAMTLLEQIESLERLQSSL